MQINRVIFGFTGFIGAGKTTAINYLQEKYKAESYAFSTPLRDILRRTYEPETRENLQKLSNILRDGFGQDLLAKIIAQDVRESIAHLIGVDGVRRPADIAHLREIDGFHLIYITADMETRYTRLTERGQNPDDATKTFEQFKADQEREAEQKIPEIATEATETIDNNGTLEQLYAQLDSLVGKYNIRKDVSD